jgi:hypothetical protein
MTYSTGNIILASDYNSFVGPTASGGTAGANLNDIWATGSGDKGWGQTAINNVSAGNTVTAGVSTPIASATQWAGFITNLGLAGSQTNTTVTARTAPVAGNTISVFANLNTDLTSVTTNRGNAALAGTEYGTFSGTTSKTAATGSGQTTWTITFTHTITFPSANQARYFWNAGGIVRLKYGKSSTGTDIDPDWNTFAGYCGTINLTGRVAGASQTIAGQAYTGTTRLGGSGGTQTTLATTTGWYNLTTSPTTIFQLNNTNAPYTGEYIQTTATATSSTVLTLVTTWYQPAVAAAGTSCNISGGTATNSPSTTITGTAPTTLVTYIPPSTSYLSNSWGTPSIAASVA